MTNAETLPYKDPSLPVAQRAADLLARMTLVEKVAQLVQVYVLPQTRQEIIERIRATGLGSRILTETNLAGNVTQRIAELEDLNELQRIAVEESRLGIPLLYGRDVIHGHRTVFPIPLAMAATFDPQAVEEAYAIAAREAASAGVHWSFAPMLDIARDPRWGRIIEGFGEDPCLCAAMAAAAVRGFQGDGLSPASNEPSAVAKSGPRQHILACAKHFIGYGAAEGGRDYNTVEISDNTLRNIYLPPYRAAVDAGAGSVMSAFHDLNGEPATGSHYLLSELLKDELGFAGFVISDWASVVDLRTHRVVAGEREAAQRALEAGVDMEMGSDCYAHHLAERVESGAIPQARLDDAVRRVLEAKFRLGLFEQPYTDPARVQRIQFTPEHQAAARRTASRSMVLLKNSGVLPLTPGGRRVAVIGPFAQERRTLLGSWVNDGLIDETPTLLEEFRRAWPQSEIVTADTGLYDDMLRVAAWSDLVILALGESNSRNGEANCVASLELSAGQEELAAAVAGLGKPLVVVVLAGRPVALTRVLPHADALLYAWHPGSRGAAAVADVITGAVNPSGKLPVTFPRAAGQVPIYYNAKSTGRPWLQYVDMPAEPLFPFGFGLSYTAFAYSHLEMSAVEVAAGASVAVSAWVTNTGGRAGEEVVQCYVQDCVSTLTRPVRELKGFARVVLQPGETRQVSFALGPQELSYYGPASKRGYGVPRGEWVLEPGEFTVWMGGDSTAELSGSFRVIPAQSLSHDG